MHGSNGSKGDKGDKGDTGPAGPAGPGSVLDQRPERAPCTNPTVSTTTKGGIDLTFNSSGDAVLQCIYASGGSPDAGSAKGLGTLNCAVSVEDSGVTAVGTVCWFMVTSNCSTGVSFSLTGPAGDQFDLYPNPFSAAV